MVLYVSVILKTALEYVVISFSSQRYSISYMSSLFDHWWVSEGMLADLSSAMIRFVQMKKMICEQSHGMLDLLEMNRNFFIKGNIPEQSNFSGPETNCKWPQLLPIFIIKIIKEAINYLKQLWIDTSFKLGFIWCSHNPIFFLDIHFHVEQAFHGFRGQHVQ